MGYIFADHEGQERIVDVIDSESSPISQNTANFAKYRQYVI